MIIDTHMHIYEDEYNGIREEIISRSLANNVVKQIAIGYDYESSIKALELANKYSFIYCAIGLHPSNVQEEKDLSLSWIKKLANNTKVVAIGEIGLDYYWDKTYVDLQKEMFRKQITIAKELNLPIIVHSRDAINDTYEIMKDANVKGVLHCFSSSLEMAQKFTNLGYFLGIGGVVTFKNSKEIKRVVEGIDLKYLLSETDSPYLAPVPYRGKMNSPEYLPYIIAQISKIKCEKMETIVNNQSNCFDQKMIEEILYNNACELFRLER